jgi:hypothetical protein
VLGATFGLVVSTDGGERWRWSCAAAYGADPTIEDPDVVVADDGSVILGTFDGIEHGEPDLCEFAASLGDVQGAFAVDLEADPIRPERTWGLISTGLRADLLVRSDDRGRSWEPVGSPFEELLLERMAIAPSDSARIYIGAAIPSPTTPRAFFLRSDDGGETFAQIEIPLIEGERQCRVLGVDPTNSDRVFVRIARGQFDTRPERLLYTADGGATFESVLELPNMLGFAISEDGSAVWASSALNRGIWAASGGGTSFEQVSSLNAQCLAARGNELWACADQLAAGFAVGRSTDGGARFEPVFRFEDGTVLVECARCSTAGVECPAWQGDLNADLRAYLTGQDAGMTGGIRDAGRPTECGFDGGSGAALDAGMTPPAAATGCACRVGRASGGAAGGGRRGLGAAAAGCALALGALRARRGRRSEGRGGTLRP